MANPSRLLPLALVAVVGITLTVRHGNTDSQLTGTASVVAPPDHGPAADVAATLGESSVAHAQEAPSVAPLEDELPAGPRLKERPPEELVALALGADAADDRAAAVDALAYAVSCESGKDDYVMSVLIQALMDGDARVREQSLVTLKDTARELPVMAVAQVARDDPDPQLRIQALELLLERNDDLASAPLATALADPEPAVRDRARELIEDRHLGLEQG